MTETADFNNPYTPDAEEYVLGCIFKEPSLIKETRLTPHNFNTVAEFGKRANMFNLMLNMDRDGLEIDPATIFARLNNDEERMATIGGVSYILDLYNTIANPRNFRQYEDAIFEQYRGRELNKLGAELMAGKIDQHTLKERTEKIEAAGKVEDRKTLKDGLVELYDHIESSDGKIKGARYGLRDLDKMTHGIHRQELTIVAARPSVGKTAFAVNVARLSARSPRNLNGAAIQIHALEQPQRQLISRIVAAEVNLDSQRIRIGKTAFDNEDWRKLTMGMGLVGDMDLDIVDKSGVSLNDIRAEARAFKKKFPPEQDVVIMIDYLQLIRGNPKLEGNKNAQVGEIVVGLKQMARELDVSVIALSQLSRGVEQRQDKRPMLSDLRESGELEQAADTVAMLYRDDYYNKETEDQNMLEVIIVKQREGPTGTVKLAMIKEYGKLVTIDWGGVKELETVE